MTDVELSQLKEQLLADIKSKTEATEESCRFHMIDLLELSDPDKFR